MRSRSLILVLIAGFILAVGALGAARRDRDQARTQTTTAPATAPAPAGTGGAQADLVKATLPADRVVRARLGDEIELRVTSAAPDVAKIVELGVQAAVGPDIPGTVSFRALAEGSFDVMLEVSGDRAGRLEISADIE